MVKAKACGVNGVAFKTLTFHKVV